MCTVSVIITAFNQEDLIERTIRSVLLQSFSDLEVIVVDDHSTDSTQAICEALVKRDNRIVYRRQSKNQGFRAARNLGIEIARGKWLRFMDGDDTLPADSLEVMVRAALNTGADFVLGDITLIYPDGTKRRKKAIDLPPCVIEETNLETLAQIPISELGYTGKIGETGFGFAQSLFNAEIIRSYSIRYDEKMGLGEDKFFAFQYMQRISKAVYIDATVYDYYLFENSLSHKPRPENTDYLKYYQRELLSFIQKNGLDGCRESYKVGSLNTLILAWLLGGEKSAKRLRNLCDCDEFSQELSQLDISVFSPLSRKIEAFLIKNRMIGAYCLLRNVYGIIKKEK